jgi:hypothetical protein
MRCIPGRPCGSTWLLPLRMTVYIRFKPSPALPGSLETNSIKSPRTSFADWDGLIAALHVPRYHWEAAITIGARWIWLRRGPVIMQTRYLQLVDHFEPAASCALGLDTRASASGSCGGKHGFGGVQSADGQSSSLRRRSTPGWIPAALNNRRSTSKMARRGLLCVELTNPRAASRMGSRHMRAAQHNVRNRCSVGARRREKGTRAANGRAGPADQKRSASCTTSLVQLAAGVVVPTSLPKLLYRKLHPRAVKRR